MGEINEVCFIENVEIHTFIVTSPYLGSDLDSTQLSKISCGAPGGCRHGTGYAIAPDISGICVIICYLPCDDPIYMHHCVYYVNIIMFI